MSIVRVSSSLYTEFGSATFTDCFSPLPLEYTEQEQDILFRKWVRSAYTSMLERVSIWGKADIPLPALRTARKLLATLFGEVDLTDAP